MYSIYQRLNVLSALLSSCLLALVAAVAVSSFAFSADPKGALAVSNIKV
jgi:signal peptidase complex subunit 3